MEPKKTALYETHQKLGAKMVDFAGYWMPVQYQGILDEHRRVRKTVGLFDVSHMGEFIIRGEKKLEFLQMLTINDVSKLEIDQIQYSAMCYPDGGIVDDILVYRFPDYYLTVVNASNLEKDFNWMQQHLIPGVKLENVSDNCSLLALQGRDATRVLQKLTPADLASLAYYWLVETKVAGVPAFISRTGYTGELGYEISFAPAAAEKIWNAIMDAGEEFEIQPIGLGARDTLRLEMKYCLYGNDIDQTTNPLEAGLRWATKLRKGDFIGRDALLKVKKAGLKRKLVSLVMEERAIPRHGYPVLKDGKEIGVVTSGTMSPMLEQGIAMAYVATEFSKVDSIVDIQIRKKVVPARVVKPPVYKIPY